MRVLEVGHTVTLQARVLHAVKTYVEMVTTESTKSECTFQVCSCCMVKKHVNLVTAHVNKLSPTFVDIGKFSSIFVDLGLEIYINIHCRAAVIVLWVCVRPPNVRVSQSASWCRLAALPEPAS